jgi:SnoaL-like domain
MSDLRAIADRVQIEALRGEADTASGRAYICEFMRFGDGRTELNYAIYHDRYRRTGDGWKFTERIYEVRYLDHRPLAGSAPDRRAPADASATGSTAAPDRSGRAVTDKEVT